MELENTNNEIQTLYGEIKSVLMQSRTKAYNAVNSAMVTAYWSIGQLIVEHEQKGGKRAKYGKAVLDDLSARLTADFGKGFDARNLRNMRKFYLLFPIWNTVRTELTWSHYRSLLRVENEQARAWYVKEAVREQWSSRQLDRYSVMHGNEQLFASKYKLYLPTEEELRAEIEREKAIFYLQQK